MADTYQIVMRKGEPGFRAVVTGPGLPDDGDSRVAESVWELCTQVTLAIQDANPEFVKPFTLVAPPGDAMHWAHDDP